MRRVVKLILVKLIFFSIKMNMSITQGLAELKLLDKRITKALGSRCDFEWAQLRTKAKKVDEADLKKTVQSEYQSYMDLVKRRDVIKRAIVLSNAQTQVTIGTGPKKWSGTVAEAIEHKSSLKYKKTLLDYMESNLDRVENEYTDAMEALDKRLDGLLTSELGKDVKTNPETITALRNSFMETNKVEIVDPMNVKKMAKDLEEEIDAFESNVDWVLSEANGKTMITV
jgi:arsenate reductase-like glutaredoxin family protein